VSGEHRRLSAVRNSRSASCSAVAASAGARSPTRDEHQDLQLLRPRRLRKDTTSSNTRRTTEYVGDQSTRDLQSAEPADASDPLAQQRPHTGDRLRTPRRREAIFWQTQKTAAAQPTRREDPPPAHTRRRGHDHRRHPGALALPLRLARSRNGTGDVSAGDYAVSARDGTVVAAIEPTLTPPTPGRRLRLASRASPDHVDRRDRLGGLLHEDELAV
jgi:hypothetical protein